MNLIAPEDPNRRRLADRARAAVAGPNQVVYFDESYPTGWIGRRPAKQQDQPQVIRDFLVARGFVALNANELKNWMEDWTKRGDATGTVVVFSQDVLPVSVAHAPEPNALVRSYLDVGGRVVWVGDIPGWQLAQPLKMTPSAPSGELGPYAIFGLVPVFVHSPEGMASSTGLARRTGLFRSPWYGMRPMGKAGRGYMKRLAYSRPRPPLRAKEILPQLAIEPGKSLVGTALQVVVNLRDFLVSLAALIGGIGFFGVLVGGTPALSTFVLGALSFMLALVNALLAGELWRLRRRANAWCKAYGHDRVGWLVRIWDFNPPVISDEMLRDLEVASSLQPKGPLFRRLRL